MKKAATIGLGAIIGGVLLSMWWDQYGEGISGLDDANWGWLLLGVTCAVMSIWVQLLRTSRLVEGVRPGQLASAVLLSHGMNVLLPSLLGDAYEVKAIAQQTGSQARAILLRLIHRFGTTISALGVLMGAALLTVNPNLGFLVLVVSVALPFVIDGFLPRLGTWLSAEDTQPLGAAQTRFHMGLALMQHFISTVGVFCLGVAIKDAISPATSAAMLAIADGVTYLPVPLGGVGVNHWAVTAICDLLGNLPITLVAFNHGMVVLIGGIAAGIGLATRPRAVHNG